MKYYLLLEGKIIERILRSPHTVSYEQMITSEEGDFFVDNKVYKIKKEERPEYIEKVGELELRVDPSRETMSLCWQIPVPHQTVAETVRTFSISPTLSFVYRPKTFYFQGSTPFEISTWLQPFLNGETNVRGEVVG